MLDIVLLQQCFEFLRKEGRCIIRQDYLRYGVFQKPTFSDRFAEVPRFDPADGMELTPFAEKVLHHQDMYISRLTFRQRFAKDDRLTFAYP